MVVHLLACCPPPSASAHSLRSRQIGGLDSHNGAYAIGKSRVEIKVHGVGSVVFT